MLRRHLAMLMSGTDAMAAGKNDEGKVFGSSMGSIGSWSPSFGAVAIIGRSTVLIGEATAPR